MYATPVLRAGRPSFWKRSLDELKRQAGVAIRMEGLERPTKPFPLVVFDSEDKISHCKHFYDGNTFGGFSKSSFTFIPASKDSPASLERPSPPHALFKGNISTELPPNKPDVQRSGFAAWRTHDRGWSLFGKLLWDIDPYDFIALKVKSDGRKYFVNLQTESIVPTDIHQHLLPTMSPGEWETVVIPINSFVRTNYGMVVEPQSELLRQKVRSVGIGSTDRVQGPFELRIAEIYATNEPPQRDNIYSGFESDEKDKHRSEEEKDTEAFFGELKRKKSKPEQRLHS